MLSFSRVLEEQSELFKCLHEIANIRDIIAASNYDNIQSMVAAVSKVLGVSIELLKPS